MKPMKIILVGDKDIIRKIAFRNRYDLLANDASRDIFDIIKNNYLNKVDVQKSFEYKNSNYVIDLYLSSGDLFNKAFDMDAHFYPPEEGTQLPPYIEMRIVLDNGFSEDNFEKLNYSIYQFIRHEYEHFYNCDKNVYPDKEYYDNLKLLQRPDLTDIERAKLIEKNVLHSHEIDSYAKSIVYLAKKRKIRFQQVLWETLDIMFFGFGDKERESGHRNVKIMKIYENILWKLKERIEKIYSLRRMAAISTRGLER